MTVSFNGAAVIANVVDALGREVVHMPGVVRVDELFGWTQLDSILSTHRLTPPRLRIVRERNLMSHAVTDRHVASGENVPVLRPADLYAELRRGATVILDGVEELDPNVSSFADRLSDAVGEAVQVNLFASFAAVPSFGAHHDEHDALVLQVSGEKQWTLGEPGRPSAAGEQDSAEQQLTMREGDALYFPQGTMHDPVAQNGPSLHLTFGFSRASLKDLMTWMADLEGWDMLDAGDAGPLTTAPSRMKPELLDDFKLHRRALHWRRPEVHLLAGVCGAIDPNTVISVRPPLIRPAPESCTLISNSRRFEISTKAARAITWIHDESTVTTHDLVEKFDEDVAREVLTTVVKSGLLLRR